MKRITPILGMLALALVGMSCGGNSTLDNTEAAVILTIDIEGYGPDIDICVWSTDIAIEDMGILSQAKDRGSTLGPGQDVNLRLWVVRPYRTDGGTTASPEWIYDQAVYVPAGGTASLENYRIYPHEFLSQLPLSYLLPENGGFDPETGNSNIRQTFELQMFGQTVSGKSVATEPIGIAFNFFCLGQ